MKKLIITVGFLFFLFIFSYFYFPSFFSKKYEISLLSSKVIDEAIIPTPLETPFVATHIETPKEVKAIYMTSWVGGTPKIRENLISIIDATEINSVVIDIKDYTGKIAFKTPDNEYLTNVGSQENRIPNVSDLLQTLHEKDIYVIGRIAVFQDPYFVEKHPDLAVKRKSDGKIWKDRKGIPWIDAGSKEVWDYVIEISKEAYKLGFDEINFDYIRFPSDGNMMDIQYPFSEGKIKSEVMKEFFSYLNQHLKNFKPETSGGFLQKINKKTDSIVISADLFGLTTSSRDDLGIGQILEDALLYFDYVAPMIYPSHYPPTFNGYKNPADHPYEIVKFALDSAVVRAENATTTKNKIRPWLQDFDLGAVYTKEMVRAQIQATYDAGLNSWMLWDPKNLYTREALLSN